MSRMKRKTQKGLNAKKVSISKQRRVSSVLAGLRQLRYSRPFRIPSPFWPPELQQALELLAIREPKVVNAETKQLLKLIADLATSLWRIRRKLTPESGDGSRAISRHIESAFDTLTAANVEVKDHTGQKYVTGMALKVIAIQPNPSLHTEIITETIKPTIFYTDILIQRGEVAVETPTADSSVQKSDDSSKG